MRQGENTILVSGQVPDKTNNTPELSSFEKLINVESLDDGGSYDEVLKNGSLKAKKQPNKVNSSLRDFLKLPSDAGSFTLTSNSAISSSVGGDSRSHGSGAALSVSIKSITSKESDES